MLPSLVRLPMSAGVLLVALATIVAGGGILAAPSSGADTVTWTAVTPPAPGTGFSSLYGLSCPSVGSCVAVGTASVFQGYVALVETLTGSTWTSTELSQPGVTVPELNAVWCSTTTSCVAVGAAGSVNTPSPLIETLADGSWTANTTVPTPSGTTTATLNTISCITTTSCVAAGSYTDSVGNTHALFETLSDGVWTSATSPDLPGATDTGVDSIQCFSTTSCLAVGGWGPSDTTTNALLETLSGSTWTASSLQSDLYLRSLWCESSTSCRAVGYQNSASSEVETLSGATWSATALPGVGGGGSDNGTVGISCTTISSCVTIGGWRPPGLAASDPLLDVETLAGGVWSPTDFGAPEGYLFPEAIACPSISTCVGVGQSEDSPATAQSIVESTVSTGSPTTTTSPGPPTPTPAPQHGYWLVGSDGGIFTFGSAGFYGSTGNLKLQRPVVGITPTLAHSGYWLVASDGGVFAFNAPFVGSIPGLGLNPAGSGLSHSLNAPIVGIVPSANGQGYYMVASDGGVFAFNSAFAGSCPGIGGCNGTAVAVTPDASGEGYWLVTATGHVYSFGDAPYFGAPGPQGSSITSMVRTPDGGGYWILDAGGQVFAFGNAGNFGSPSGSFGGLNPATAVLTTSDGGGYWVASANGTVDAYGDAPNDGGMASTHLNGSIIAGSGF
jgi:hypothetical protein